MRCMHCGNEIDDNVTICPVCGADPSAKEDGAEGSKQDQGGSSGIEWSIASTGGQTGGSGGSNNGGPDHRKLILGICAAAVAIAAVLLIVLFVGKKPETPGTSTASAEAEAEKQPTEETAEAEPEEQPAEGTAEAEPEEQPAEGTAEAEPEKQPAEETAEAEPEEQPAEETAETVPQEQTGEDTAEAEPQYRIPERALYYNGHHYYIYTDAPEDWEDVVNRCLERGGYPAVINDREENEELFRYMLDMGFEQAYIGLTYNERSDRWYYQVGGSSDFTDWGYNSRGEAEPNNSGGSEYNVEMDINMEDGHWNDAEYGAQVYTPDGESYKDRYTYICEWDG